MKNKPQLKKIDYIISGTYEINDKDVIFHIPTFKAGQKIKLTFPK